MKIIISPAKTIKISDDYALEMTSPIFEDKTKDIMDYIKSLSYDEAKLMWKCNDKIATLNFDRFKEMDLKQNINPALFAYEGLQYQYISAKTLEKSDLEYLEKNLRILSGFYGVLRPSTAITPYRLEMQALINHKEYTNLYDYWGESLVDELIKDGDKLILNLASKEYSKCISKYDKEKDISILTINFCEFKDGKLKQKATLAKMARGEFVRSLAVRKIKDIEEIKKLKILDFEYAEELSTKEEFTYIKIV